MVTQNRDSGEPGKADVPLTASSAGQTSPHSAVGADLSLGSIASGSVTETSAEGVEAHILARIAAICQPGMYQKAKQAQVHKSAWAYFSLFVDTQRGVHVHLAVSCTTVRAQQLQSCTCIH